jgi:hypothetical protein
MCRRWVDDVCHTARVWGLAALLGAVCVAVAISESEPWRECGMLSEHVTPSWFGESIGHYESGDTLVIDTIGLSTGISYIDNFRTPHSEKLHVVERSIIEPGGKGMSAHLSPRPARSRRATSLGRHIRAAWPSPLVSSSPPGSRAHRGSVSAGRSGPDA